MNPLMSAGLTIGISEHHGNNPCFAECVHPDVKEIIKSLIYHQCCDASYLNIPISDGFHLSPFMK